MKVAVLLSGSGVYDGSEIHESVLLLLHLAQNGFEVQIFAPDMDQYHVINHLTGQEISQVRNVLVESARIARGNIRSLADLDPSEFVALALPGGFGVAKNLTKWAFAGPQGEIHPLVQKTILDFAYAHKAILGLCMAPTTIAQALANHVPSIQITIGTETAPSPYEIVAIAQGVNSTGAIHCSCLADEVCVDMVNRIISVPTYMMEADLLTVDRGIKAGIAALVQMLQNPKWDCN